MEIQLNTGKIHSEMASDPDFIELLEEFVANVPERIRTIQESVAVQDRSKLCTLVHQLRGACGSYGYHDMTPLATELEISLRSGKQLDDLILQIDCFLDACSRMTSEAL